MFRPLELWLDTPQHWGAQHGPAHVRDPRVPCGNAVCRVVACLLSLHIDARHNTVKKTKNKKRYWGYIWFANARKKRKKKSNHTFANTHTCTDTGALVPPRGWFATELMCCTGWLLSFYKTLQGENKPVCTKDMLFTDVVPFINGSLWKDL